MTTSRGASPRLGRWIAVLLRGGTLGAMVLVACGYAVAALGGEAREGPRPVLEEVGRGGGDALVAVGIMALALLPLAVLGTAAVAFALAGERRMTLITLLVGALLLASLVAAAVIGPAI